MDDKNKRPADELADAAKSFRDGAAEERSIAANATVQAVKAKIGNSHNGFDRKAADLSSKRVGQGRRRPRAALLAAEPARRR